MFFALDVSQQFASVSLSFDVHSKSVCVWLGPGTGQLIASKADKSFFKMQKTPESAGAALVSSFS